MGQDEAVTLRVLNKVLLYGQPVIGRNIEWTADNQLVAVTKKSLVVMDVSRLDPLTVDQPEQEACIFPMVNVETRKLWSDLRQKTGQEKSVNYLNKLKTAVGEKNLMSIDSYKLQQAPYNLIAICDNKHHLASIHAFRCAKTGSQFLAATSVLSRVVLWKHHKYHKFSEWLLAADVSHILACYWKKEKPGISLDCNMDTLPNLVITCIKWLDFSCLTGFSSEHGSGVLCTGTQSGHIVLWLIDDMMEIDLKFFHILKDISSPVSCIEMLTDHRKSDNTRTSISFGVSFVNGKVITYKLQANSMNSTFIWSKPQLIHSKADILCADRLKWVSLGNEEHSVLIYNKATSVVAIKLNSEHKVVGRYMDLESHYLPITGLSALVVSEQNIDIISTSLDGHIVSVTLTAAMEEESRSVLASRADFSAFKGSRKHLIGFAASPNACMVATVTSRHQGQASIADPVETFVRVYLTPKASSGLVQKLLASQMRPYDNCDYLKAIELEYERYRDDIIEHCVKAIAIPFKDPIRKLQYAWKLVTSNEESPKESFMLTLQRYILMRSGVEFIRHLKKSNVFNDRDNFNHEHACYLASVKTIITMLVDYRSEFVDFDTPWLDELCATNFYKQLPTVPSCMFTGEPMFISPNFNSYVQEADRDVWPTCSLTFLPIQSSDPRRCSFCGMCSLPVLDIYPDYFTLYLLRNCPTCDGPFV